MAHNATYDFYAGFHMEQFKHFFSLCIRETDFVERQETKIFNSKLRKNITQRQSKKSENKQIS